MKLPFNFSLPLKSLISRFPVTVVLIAALAVTAYISAAILEYSDADNYQRFVLGLVSAGLVAGILTNVAIQYASERFAISALIKYIAQFVTLAVIALLVYLFMSQDIREFADLDGIWSGGTIRLIALLAISALSVFSLPFLGTKDSTQWWNFSHSNLFRLAVSYLYGLAIFLGLSLALFAIESFWDFKLLGEDQYTIISIFAFILFAPYYFLADFHKFDLSAEIEKLNKYLSFFLKFILTPLIFVYLVILYPYILQFPFQNEWPSNELSIITTVLMGMNALGFILLYGQDEISFTLFKKYKLTLHTLYYKFITLLSLPTLFFLMYSLFLRIDAYKWTVNRFGLLALIIWAIGVLLYYRFSTARNAAYVVAALAVTVIAVYMLPFTYMISKSSQEDRLVQLMEDRLTVQGGDFAHANSLTYDQNQEMVNILEYLNSFHNLSGIRPLISDEIIRSNLYTESNRVNSSEMYSIKFANDIIGGWEDPDTINDEYYSLVYTRSGLDLTDLSNRLNTVSWYSSFYNSTKFDDAEISFYIKGDRFEFTVPRESDNISEKFCPTNEEVAQELGNDGKYYMETFAICGTDQSDFTIKSDSGNLFVMKGLNGFFTDESFTLTNYSGYYIYEMK